MFNKFIGTVAVIAITVVIIGFVGTGVGDSSAGITVKNAVSGYSFKYSIGDDITYRGDYYRVIGFTINQQQTTGMVGYWYRALDENGGLRQLFAPYVDGLLLTRDGDGSDDPCPEPPGPPC